MSRWTIEYNNDTGPNDDYFVSWYDVYELKSGLSFRCKDETEANWLKNVLDIYDRMMERGGNE